VRGHGGKNKWSTLFPNYFSARQVISKKQSKVHSSPLRFESKKEHSTIEAQTNAN